MNSSLSLNSTLPASYLDNPPADHDLGPMLVKTTWSLLGVSAVVVSTRLFVKIRTLRKLFMDDYLMILALVPTVRTHTVLSPLMFTGTWPYSCSMHHRILQDRTGTTFDLHSSRGPASYPEMGLRVTSLGLLITDGRTAVDLHLLALGIWV